MKSLQVQIENLEQENKQIDEDITKSTEQCQDYQNQLQVITNLFGFYKFCFLFIATSSSI